ncbi:MAG: GNAT family N-acetyltransferase [Phycisphaerales bacterium]|nr:GNAT family N-acetyltransferase [Phycisphaerales bacterium]
MAASSSGTTKNEAAPEQRQPVAVGKLVLLRFPEEADRAAYIALRRESRAFLEPWEPLPRPGLDPWGDSGFDRELQLADTEHTRRLLICRKTDGLIVGRLGISGIERGILQTCHLGYWIGAAHVRRGYCTEAVRLALGYVFTALKLHRVEVNLQPDNVASRGVAIAAGLKQEGYSPRYIKIRGQWKDHERWAITIEDWCEHGQRS